MDASNTPANAERQAFPSAEFSAWLDEEYTTALVSEDHGQFYAYCVEFGIAGSGATKEEAVSKVVGLLMRYLVVSYSEGQSYADTKKTPSRGIRLRRSYLTVRTKLLGRVKPPLSRLGGLISVPMTDRDTHGLVH